MAKKLRYFKPSIKEKKMKLILLFNENFTGSPLLAACDPPECGQGANPPQCSSGCFDKCCP